MWGRGELPADVAGLKAEILRSSRGSDHRVDVGSSPAQTHRRGPPPTAVLPTQLPAPLAGLPWWAAGGRSGCTLGSPPQRLPWHHLPLSSQEGATSPASSPPCSCSRPAPPRPRSLRVPGRPPPGGARRPVTQGRGWGLGGAEERWFLESGGEGQLGEVPHPPPPPRAWEALGLQRGGTQGNNGDGGEGERAPPDKGPPSPAPGVSSFLQVLLHSLQGGSAGGWHGVGGGSRTHPV